MSFKTEVKGIKVLIFGLGLQGGGVGDALWLHASGAQVRVTDRKSAAELESSLRELPSQVEQSLGGHLQADIDWADIVIKNPGVPDSEPLLKEARKQGKPVLTSIAVFVREAKGKVIGITGTRGKSTTTELIYRVMNEAYPGRVIRGGNIPGTSGLALLDEIAHADFAVLELSSFQLHNFHELRVSPHVAVVTNLYPDHLNRYAGMEEYLADKKAVCAYQTQEDLVAVNAGNPGALEIAAVSVGVHHEYRASDIPADWHVHIPGEHNRENIAAVLAVSRALNIQDDLVKKVIEKFHGLPFRLEDRGEKGGVVYINDTTSTTPTAGIKAVLAMTKPTCIIVGGETKNLSDTEFVEALRSSALIKKIVILGSVNNSAFTGKLQKACPGKIIGQVDSMEAAVQVAARHALPGWAVLLSPGFASFDLFQNEFDRGRQFNAVVDKL